jgi:hypothetical protein
MFLNGPDLRMMMMMIPQEIILACRGSSQGQRNRG